MNRLTLLKGGDIMFRIRTTAHGYTATLDDTTYFIGNVKPSEGYPKKAKYPYKARISLMKDKKFIPLSKSDAQARQIYSAIIPEVCAHIAREKDIERRIKEDEEAQYALLEQTLDDLED